MSQDIDNAVADVLTSKRLKLVHPGDGRLTQVYATSSEVTSMLAEAVNQGPPSEREWKLAEVEYLLRIANHRILMERDVVAARDLLSAADAVLNDLDDFRCISVVGNFTRL